MKIENHQIQVKTRGKTDIIDLTSNVREIIAGSEVKDGHAVIFCVGSTGGISTLEYEPGLVGHDVADMFEKLAPYGKHYHHNKTWGDDNGAAHLRSAITGTSFIVPFESKRPFLGTWQQIVFIDFDTRPRERKIVVQLMGV